MNRAALLVLCALTITPAGLTQAATIERKGDSVVVTGRFERGDFETFRRIAQERITKDTVVIFESPGGALRVGLEMGEFIRMRGLTTFVGPGRMCASACAIAWLAGNPRGAATTAKIGFHAAADKDGTEKGGANALIGAFLAKIGLSDEAVYYVTMKSPNEIQWLDFDDAKKLGIDVHLMTPEQLAAPSGPERPITDVTPPAVASPAPPSAQPTPKSASLELELLKLKVEQFVHAHRARWMVLENGQSSTIGPKMREDYADRVIYYGKEMSRDEVMLARRRYAERVRWDYMKYNVPRRNPTVVCDGPICKVTGILDAFNKSTASYEYKVRRDPTNLRFEILLETSTAFASAAAPIAKAPGKPSPTVKRDPCTPEQWVCRALRIQRGQQ